MTAPGSRHNVGSVAHPSAGPVEQLGSALSVGHGGQQGGARVEIYDTLWKAAPDVFVVSAAAERIIDAAADEMSALRLISHHPNLTFVTHTRRAEAKAGPALVISDVAEWDGGERHTAVVVSIVVDDDSTPSGGRRATVRTHLEDDHTRVSGTALEFEEHHDLLRAALVDAIRRADPGALHVEAPSPSPERDRRPVAAIRVEPTPWSGPEHASDIVVYHDPGVDLGALAGVGLMVVGIVAMVLAVVSGTFQLAVAGVAFGVCLAYTGSRLHGF